MDERSHFLLEKCSGEALLAANVCLLARAPQASRSPYTSHTRLCARLGKAETLLH